MKTMATGGGSDYFGGVLRSAGLAPPPALSIPVAAAEPFDPFEAMGMEDAAPPPAPPRAGPVIDTPHAGDSPTPQPPRSAAPAEPSQPPQPHIADVARDAPPNVQAALRWIAAGEPVQKPVAVAPAQETPPAALPRSVPASAHRPMPAALPATAQAGAPTPPHGEPAMLRQIDAPPPLPAALTPEAPVKPAVRAALPATHTENPRRSHATEALQRAAPARVAAEVHIGTLHVTLDAATAARFAPPKAAVTAPEAPRLHAPRPDAGAAAAGPQGGGSLSRSRLPRW